MTAVSEEIQQNVDAWRAELDRYPDKRLYHRLAEALLELGRPAAALEIAERGITRHAKYWSCQEVQGAALVALGRYDEALAVLEPIGARVGAEEAKRQQAMALFGLGREDDARRICRELLQRDPFDKTAQRLLRVGAAALPKPVSDDAPQPPAEPEPAAAPEPEPEPEPAPAPAEQPAIEPPPPPVQKPMPPRPPQSSVAEPQQPFDDLSTSETDKLVDDFFDPLMDDDSPNAKTADTVVRAKTAQEEVSPALVAPEGTEIVEEGDQALSQEEVATEGDASFAPEKADDDVEEDDVDDAREYDPTEGMDADIDIDDIDVFGELGDGPTRAAAPSAPEAPSPSQEATEAAREPLAEQSELETQAAAPPDQGQRKDKKKKRRWKRWLDKKENG